MAISKLPAKPGPVGMIAGQVFIGFQRVVDDRAEGGPAGMRRATGAQGMRADRDMRKVAAGFGPRTVNLAEISVEEDTTGF